MSGYEGIERVLSIFDKINRVPRPTGYFECIHPWLMNWGKEHGLEVRSDTSHNLLIKVPATSGFESSPIIILQGHMDMVCEKRPDAQHDFRKNPIVSWRDGDWLRAKNTSLGADNGIALAMFFELVEDGEAEHPELEILITSDEESGMIGAQKLEKDFLSGKVLLNLDSETEGMFTIGCAGGIDINLDFPIKREAAPKSYAARRLLVGGLEGGHSGIEINSGKTNANVLLVRAIREFNLAVPELQIGELNGGLTRNAIPRDASAILALPKSHLGIIQSALNKFSDSVAEEFGDIEKDMFAKLEVASLPQRGLINPAYQARLIDALRLIPHGVRAMYLDDLVDTSMNFAVLRSGEGSIEVLANRRSARPSRGIDFSDIIAGLARIYGGSFSTGNYYPGWEPNENSDVLRRSKRIWAELFGTECEVELTHAGLECGAIGERFPNLDMISFGPTILQPHSPDERLYIPSVGRVRLFLRELLKSYGEKGDRGAGNPGST